MCIQGVLFIHVHTRCAVYTCAYKVCCLYMCIQGVLFIHVHTRCAVYTCTYKVCCLYMCIQCVLFSHKSTNAPVIISKVHDWGLNGFMFLGIGFPLYLSVLVIYNSRVSRDSPPAAPQGLQTLHLLHHKVSRLSTCCTTRSPETPPAAPQGLQRLHLLHHKVSRDSPPAAPQGLQRLHLLHHKVSRDSPPRALHLLHHKSWTHDHALRWTLSWIFIWHVERYVVTQIYHIQSMCVLFSCMFKFNFIYSKHIQIDINDKFLQYIAGDIAC